MSGEGIKVESGDGVSWDVGRVAGVRGGRKGRFGAGDGLVTKANARSGIVTTTTNSTTATAAATATPI